MPSEPRWLDAADLIPVNAEVTERAGEPHSLVDLGKLESACGRPRNRWAYGGEEDMVVLAAALLFGVSQAQAFLQGNKRTGFVGALMLMRLNGWTLSAEADSVGLAEAVLELIREGMSEEGFAEFLRPHIIPFES